MKGSYNSKELSTMSYKTILITGASSGIGQALAEQYAQKGVTLILTGRDQDRLTEIQQICALKGAQVIAKVIDVRDHKAMHAWIKDMDSHHTIDLAVANAGIGLGQRPDTWETTDEIIQTNLYGVLNTLLPLIPRMKERKSGHLAVMSSLAAFRSFPGHGPYSASKSA